MRLTILGYYGGYPDHGVGTSSYLIESGDYKLLLDCGSGALLALEKVTAPFSLDAVLLTHYHHDHAADVGVLQYYYQLHSGQKKVTPLPIYGHSKDPLNFAALTFGQFTQGIAYSAEAPLELGPLTLTFLETQHPVPAFAVRIQERATGQVFVDTSDTRAFAGLAPFCEGAELLMADTNFLAAHPAPMWHLTSQQAGALAARAHVGTLLLTHLPQEVSLTQLKQEAQAAAGTIPVLLASEQTVIDGNKLSRTK
ncbi:MBL fold metallo-hydrolase [Lacticaseibacillus jixianensis]|uniref:MBL fold metallo-hydrolase n=1 Tax=Lacticaseibacillus jixianensis TaxID=2486012 RepID=A0ABW4B9S1_9LACO|nr:MBL fold metallo-hydrolase [Lacticaseibacillus jixianensis]